MKTIEIPFRTWTTAAVVVATLMVPLVTLSACGSNSNVSTAGSDVPTSREEEPHGDEVAAEIPDWMLLASESDVVTFMTQPTDTGAVKGETGPFVLAADALFEPNSAQLTMPAFAALRRFTLRLPAGQLKVMVVGFTDNRGTVQDNIALALARAEAVAAVFIKELGNRVELHISSKGESEAIGSTPEQMALDRRVLVTVKAR